MSNLTETERTLAEDICWWCVKYCGGIDTWHELNNTGAFVTCDDGTDYEFYITTIDGVDVVVAEEETGIDLITGDRIYQNYIICQFGKKNYRKKRA